MWCSFETKSNWRNKPLLKEIGVCLTTRDVEFFLSLTVPVKGSEHCVWVLTSQTLCHDRWGERSLLINDWEAISEGWLMIITHPLLPILDCTYHNAMISLVLEFSHHHHLAVSYIHNYPIKITLLLQYLPVSLCREVSLVSLFYFLDVTLTKYEYNIGDSRVK